MSKNPIFQEVSPMQCKWFKFIPLFFVVLLGAACVSMSPVIGSPTEWMEGKDYPVTIRFNGAKPESLANVVVHYQLGTAEITDEAMVKMGDEYRFTIPHKQIKPGELVFYISYIYEAKEANTVTRKVRILSFAEAKHKYEENLLSRVVFLPPKEVPIVEDLPLPFRIRGARPSTSVTIFITPDVHPSYREETIPGQNGIFDINIKKNMLEDGYNTYYFRITENHEDFGEIEIFYPPQGENTPLSFTILNTKELLSRMTKELVQAVEFNAPQEVYVEQDWQPEISLHYAPDSFLSHFTNHQLTAVLYYRQPRALTYHREEMVTSQDFPGRLTLQSLVPAMYLKNGYNQYYFKLIDNTRLGEVAINYPPQGEKVPLTFKLLTIEELRDRKSAELYNRLGHHPPASPVAGLTDLNLTLTVKHSAPGTIAVFYYKKSSQYEYSSRPMNRDGDNFTVTLTAQEQLAGYNQYYFSVQETDAAAGQVSVNFKQLQGEVSPFSFQLEDPEQVRARLLADLNLRIRHVPVKEAAADEPLIIQTAIKEAEPDTQVLVYYKRPGDYSFRLLATNSQPAQNHELLFSAQIPREDILGGYNQYYIQVKEIHPNIGPLVILLPQSGAARPFTYTIRKPQEAGMKGNQ